MKGGGEGGGSGIISAAAVVAIIKGVGMGGCGGTVAGGSSMTVSYRQLAGIITEVAPVV